MYIIYTYYFDCRDAIEAQTPFLPVQLFIFLIEKRNHNNAGSEYTLVLAPTHEPPPSPWPCPPSRHLWRRRSLLYHRRQVDLCWQSSRECDQKGFGEPFKEPGKVLQINIISKTFGKPSTWVLQFILTQLSRQRCQQRCFRRVHHSARS